MKKLTIDGNEDTQQCLHPKPILSIINKYLNVKDVAQEEFGLLETNLGTDENTERPPVKRIKIEEIEATAAVVVTDIETPSANVIKEKN